MDIQAHPFNEQGQGLLQALDGPLESTAVLDSIRGWMDDAPNHPPVATLAMWGYMAHALCQVALGNQTDSGDPRRVAAYMDTVGRVDESIFWLAGGRKAYPDGGGDYQMSIEYPVYQALFRTVVGLSQFGMERVHPMLERMVCDIAWEPLPFLTTLFSSMGRQFQEAELMAQLLESFKPSIGIETAHARFSCALRPLVLDTPWRPEDNRIFGDVLRVHFQRGSKQIDGMAERNALFVARWMQATPSALGQVIEQIAGVSAHELPQLFPLNFEAAPALEVVKALVSMHGRRAWMSAKNWSELEHEFTKHHPHIWNMLSTHAMIFPDGKEAFDNADVLLDGFVHLCMHSTFGSDIASQLFEEAPQ